MSVRQRQTEFTLCCLAGRNTAELFRFCSHSGAEDMSEHAPNAQLTSSWGPRCSCREDRTEFICLHCYKFVTTHSGCVPNLNLPFPEARRATTDTRISLSAPLGRLNVYTDYMVHPIVIQGVSRFNKALLFWVSTRFQINQTVKIIYFCTQRGSTATVIVSKKMNGQKKSAWDVSTYMHFTIKNETFILQNVNTFSKETIPATLILHS